MYQNIVLLSLVVSYFMDCGYTVGLNTLSFPKFSRQFLT